MRSPKPRPAGSTPATVANCCSEVPGETVADECWRGIEAVPRASTPERRVRVTSPAPIGSRRSPAAPCNEAEEGDGRRVALTCERHRTRLGCAGTGNEATLRAYLRCEFLPALRDWSGCATNAARWGSSPHVGTSMPEGGDVVAARPNVRGNSAPPDGARHGWLAERLGAGLQTLTSRFESAAILQNGPEVAMGRHLPCTEALAGSIPVGSTNSLRA